MKTDFSNQEKIYKDGQDRQDKNKICEICLIYQYHHLIY